ncbi:MAG: LysR family transcriptional regulator [Clostridium sp.]|nr:LysR family transcriptional regulator [Clostridium sp.]
MELRVLEYFLAVAREQNITRAAEYLHLTQPTLSRQLSDLENEFGKQLLIRGKRKVTLTNEGLFFRKRAEEIISLAKRTETEMKTVSDSITGDIYIGTGESVSIRNIIRVAHNVQAKYTDIHFHFTSGDSVDLIDRLDKGLFDFCILYGDIDQSKYEYITLPYTERWGVIMPCNHELAAKDTIDAKDLWDKPLILSRHSLNNSSFIKWFGRNIEELNIANTYNLVYNGMLMADEGMGLLVTLKDLVNTQGTNLCFKLIHPAQSLPLSIVWKKYQAHSKAAERFIEELNSNIKND